MIRMATSASQVTLQLKPRSRLDLIDVNQQISTQFGNWIEPYNHALYYSYHTTAGYLDQRFCQRFGNDSENLQSFVRSFQCIFPPGADYHHDQIELRQELTEEEKKGEPKNADAHLTFISSGLTNCATYRNKPRTPVYFIDLDGVNGTLRRLRQTTVVGFNREETAGELKLEVPMSRHSIDSINLRDPGLGLLESIREEIDRLGIRQGRIDISLDGEESHVGLTVNEYETFLMRHDLLEVLRNPLGFMAEKGRHMLSDPRSIPSKAKGYAKYDLVQVINEALDAAGLAESLIERTIHRFLAVPASRFLRMKRSLSLLVSDPDDRGSGAIVQGSYQSPILVQWQKACRDRRQLRVSFVRFS